MVRDMSVKVEYNKLFVYSNTLRAGFVEEFNSGVNIISGRNTSGKSTLIQSLLYCLGVNDVKENLFEILGFEPLFRLDISRYSNGSTERYTIIREPLAVYVIDESGKTTRFYGIDADHSVEHVKLKKFISDIFGFSLMLEQNGELKNAPLESLFLPYYVSQSVGWVYLRESFSNLNFYKGFKEDYLDYYLGINNNFDRVEHRKLLDKKKELESDIKSLRRYSKKVDFVFSQMVDEMLGEKANEYISSYKVKIDELSKVRREHVILCNDFSRIQNHVSILRRTNINLKSQSYNDEDKCPACEQTLKYSIVSIYEYYQKMNDTSNAMDVAKEKLKSIQSKINSKVKRIKELEEDIQDNYGILLRESYNGVTFEEWLDNKSDIRLYQRMTKDIIGLEYDLSVNKSKLQGMKTEEETVKARKIKEIEFYSKFSSFLSELSVKPVILPKYTELYRINSFPFQGVELHKTVMAYHFSLNYLIRNTEYIHRVPFLLDAVLKEDIDETNIELILRFIGKNVPSDTQSFISISEHKKEKVEGENIKPIEAVKVEEVNRSFFNGRAKVIYVGNGVTERSFLTPMTPDKTRFLSETYELMIRT